MDFTMTLVWISTLLTALFLLYKYFTKHFGFWESQGVPVDKAYPIFGTEFSMLRKPMHEIDLERTRKHGRIFGSYLLTGRILNIVDPEIIKLIFVKDFNNFVNRQNFKTGQKLLDCGLGLATNDDWKRIRSVVTPTFTSGKLRKMEFMFKNIAKKHGQNFAQLSENGKPIDIKETLLKYSVEVFGACVFGMSFDAFANPNHPFIVNSKKFFDGPKSFFIFYIVGIMPEAWKFLKRYLLNLTGINFFFEAAKEILQQRRIDQKQKNVDFLQLLLDAKEEKLYTDKQELSENNAINKTETTKHSTWTKTLDEDEIVAQCASFLLGGYDTIATVIAYVSYNLARHPKEQEKLLHEVDDVWDKHGDIDYDIVNKMPYLNAVISETLRLQTNGTRVLRQAREDYKIPNTNITIPKDSIVNLPLYALHHDPEFFPEPEKFDPDRFLPENKDKILPYTYMPFIEGPRNCVAMRFALINMKFCLASILRYIKFSPTEETMKPLKFIVGAPVLLTKNNVMVQLEKRRDLDKT